MAAMQLTRTHKVLIGVVVAGAVLIAAIGFAGSYAAVRELALEKGFGDFSLVFPIGIDAGICVLLALDLLLTWMRIPFPLLRQTAWLLTAATIAFNGAAAWPDPLGTGMHAVIPVLFVVSVEAARHAVGRIADITADKHMEGVRLTRWLLSPVPTFKLWRRMKLWELRSYEQVIKLEQDRLVYQARLQARFGRNWRRKAPIESMMPLRLAKYGVPLADTAPAGLAAAGIEPALLPPVPAPEPAAVETEARQPQLPYVPQRAEQPVQLLHKGQQGQQVHQEQQGRPEQQGQQGRPGPQEQHGHPEQHGAPAPTGPQAPQQPQQAQQAQPAQQAQQIQHAQQPQQPQQPQAEWPQEGPGAHHSPWFAAPQLPGDAGDAGERAYDPTQVEGLEPTPVRVPTGPGGRTRPLGNVGTIGAVPRPRLLEQQYEHEAPSHPEERDQYPGQQADQPHTGRIPAPQTQEQQPQPQQTHEQQAPEQQPQAPQAQDQQAQPQPPQAQDQQAQDQRAPQPRPQNAQPQPQNSQLQSQTPQPQDAQPPRDAQKAAEWAAAEAQFSAKAYEVFCSYTRENHDYPNAAVLDIHLADGHNVHHPRSGALLRRLLPGFKQRFDSEMSADHIA
ncbi:MULTISPECIES: DUF2637 domain-containing protein [unclassified Streptomyces]|uniref:DUF2637 domain-containing protein n=1 Tax=unclassified Streptomyces TaxID=2593676 RepID=UPI00081B16ED|nr:MULTISPECIES: DUF2637 domain-containing protein [unclassified Streptomyces]SCE38521.1 Protein of unknown function [Streptomyces sp. PalvLS-984]SDE15968.1 Cell division protein [Streptomyces sp. AmelKG-A3]